MRPTHEQTRHLPGSVTEMTQAQRREMVAIYVAYWMEYWDVKTEAKALALARQARRTRRRHAHEHLRKAAPLRKWLIEYHGLRSFPKAPTYRLIDGHRLTLMPPSLMDDEDFLVMGALGNPVIAAVREKYDALVKDANYSMHAERNEFGYFFDHLLPRTLPEASEAH